jgi:hypothetical protein
MLTIVLLYGYVDLALEMTERLERVWSADDRGLIRTRLEQMGTRRSGPAWPGRRQVAAALRRLGRWCQPSGDDWSISDPELGNLD